MMRFLPDTWRELLLRPVAMAAPDAGVYIEIMAPDLRFVFVQVLLLLLLALAWRRRPVAQPWRPAAILLATIVVTMVPWLLTTANGRYFIAGLLALGPATLALAWLLPLTRAARLAAGVLMVAMQGFVIYEASPWQAWGLARWDQAPYFQVDLPADMRTQPATYVTMSGISYSLIAPQLPPNSRWMNLVNAPAAVVDSPDARRAQRLLAEAEPGKLVLLMPIVHGTLTPEGLPNAMVSGIIDDQIAGHRLGLSKPQRCRFLYSSTVASMVYGALDKKPAAGEKHGFWACQLDYLADKGVPPPQAKPARHEAVFRALEASCPRFFVPGRVGALAIADGEVRGYPETEMKVYVLDAGHVYYKYYRAFNPVRVGSVEEVLTGKVKVDCSHIRGRSGLPWEREI